MVSSIKSGVNMLIDLLFAIGTAGFLLADVKQFWKLHINKYQTKAISRTHLKMKIFSLICVSTAYALSDLPLSFVISVSQLILTIGVTIYTYKYYNIKPAINESTIEMWDNEKDERWDKI